MKVYPASAICIPESDRDEALIAEMPKYELQEWLKDKNPDDFLIVSPEKKITPVVVLVPSRDFIAAYSRPVDTSIPIAIFKNRPVGPNGDWKLRRVIEWYERKHYQVAIH